MFYCMIDWIATLEVLVDVWALEIFACLLVFSVLVFGSVCFVHCAVLCGCASRPAVFLQA